jgi:hypothetical protein
MPRFGGLGRNFGRMGALGGSLFDGAALTLFAAMTTQPNATRKTQINNLIESLKASGAWALTDALYVFAAHDAQAALLNWKNPGANTLSESNSPTFETDRGYTGDGATSGLTGGPNLSTLGGSYSLDNAHMGAWVGTNVAENVSDFGNTTAFIRSRSAASSGVIRANDATSTTISIAVGATSVGHSLWSRSLSTSYDTYKNGAFITSPVVTTTTITNAQLTVCFVGALFSTKRVQAAHVGGALTTTQVASYYSALAAYMTAVGA